MKFYFPILAIFILSSVLLAQSASVELISPTHAKEIYIDEVDFHFKYLMGDSSQIDVMCALSIDGTQIATITAQHNQDVYYTSSSIASGNRNWSVNCNGIQSQNETFYKKPKFASVELISPNDSISTFDSTVIFKFTYHAAETGNDTAQCYLTIAYTQVGPLSLPSEEIGEIEIEQLPRKDYEWSVTCDKISSPTRTFSAVQLIPPSVESISPAAGASFDYNNPKFEFIYRAGTSGPKEAVCNLVIYPFREGAINATDGQKTFIEAKNLKIGTQYWYAECNFGTEHYATSGDAREFIVTKDASKDSNTPTNQTQNQTQNETEPIQTPKAVLIAPVTATANQPVVLKLLDKNGKPIANATIMVIPASGSPQPAFTDSSGTARFTSDSPMSFSYEVIGYELAQAPFTNVVYAVSNQTQTPPTNNSQTPTSNSSSSDNFTLYAVIVIALLALAAAAYFLFFKPKPSKPPKPVVTNEASVAQSKPAQPPSPTNE